MTKQYFLQNKSSLIIYFALTLGFFVPESGLWLTPYTMYLLMMLIIISVIDIRYRQVMQQLHKVRILSLALFGIHILGPVLVLLFRPLLDPEIFVGFLLAAAIPSGLSIIFLSQLFNGSTSESLVITVLSQILAPFLVPLVLFIFGGESVTLDLSSLMLTIAKIVIVPIIIARIIRPTKLRPLIHKHHSSASLILLFLILLGLAAPLQQSIIEHVHENIIVGGLVAICITTTMLFGYWVGKTNQEKNTLAIACSYKNYALATVTAFTLFGPLAALPAIWYTLLNNVALLPLQYLTRRRHKRTN